MNIAFDISPLQSGHFLQHRVRGTGFYTENLKRSFLKYFPEHHYTFFAREEMLPQNIDVVHYPYFEPFFLTIPFQKKYRSVVTVHDLTPLVFPGYFPPGIKGNLKWQIQKMSLKRMDAIITDSESSKKDIIHFTGISEKKVHTVYLAAGEQFKKVQSSKFKAQNLREKYHLPEGFALYVGDITWNKNLPRLIQAIKKTDIPLILVGKAIREKNFDITNLWNQDRVKIQKLIEQDKGRQIHCIGFVPDEDLVLLYNMATVFVMPSLYEGFGLPILEAMQCGCPVVTTKEGSLAEVGGNAPFYVDGYASDNIASGIQKIFSNKTLQQELSEKGLARAKEFSWEKTAKETMEVYNAIL